MIHVNRPATVPKELQRQRATGLKRALTALNAHGPGSVQLKSELKAYDGGKDILFKKQHRKCAFCDRRSGYKGNHVEHFRPKKETWRHLPGGTPRVVDPVGYWWLTWTWSNQLFACGSCNTGHKQNYFPLGAGSPSLSGPQAPYSQTELEPKHEDTSVESTLLVDPAVEDPLDHIEWRVVNPGEPKSLWKWSPGWLTPRGAVTTKVLGLVALADDVADHLRDNVMQRASEICDDIDGGHYATARTKWLRLGEDVASSTSVLAGPTWNALPILVDATRRATANLPTLPRP